MLDALHVSLPQDPAAALAEIATRFPRKVTFTTSLGEEDQAITHLIAAHNVPIRMVTLDTGRLFTESYDLLSRTRAKYKLDIDMFAPDTARCRLTSIPTASTHFTTALSCTKGVAGCVRLNRCAVRWQVRKSGSLGCERPRAITGQTSPVWRKMRLPD